MPVEAKTESDQNADDAERDADDHAELPGGSLRAHGGRQSPFAEKIPDADAQVETMTQAPR